MLDIRMIASDVDGTMLPRGGIISENLRRAIRGCRERGIPFIISSGRWIGALQDIIRQSGTEGMPMIIANGAAVIGPDGVPMREWLLDDADTRHAYEILRQFDVQVNGYVRDGLYCVNTKALKRQSTMIRDYIGAGDIRLVVDDEAAFEAVALHSAYKLEGLTEDRALIQEVRAAFEGTGLSVTHSSGRNVEIMAAGVGKGRALRWLAETHGVPMENCMAFGDNANDLDMLAAVGWPVAVGNADDSAKRVARMVTAADVDDGVARTIFEQVLGESM